VEGCGGWGPNRTCKSELQCHHAIVFAAIFNSILQCTLKGLINPTEINVRVTDSPENGFVKSDAKLFCLWDELEMNVMRYITKLTEEKNCQRITDTVKFHKYFFFCNLLF
jgi:hypothetical protein